MTNGYIPQRAMLIFAHPDDIEFGSAGTAALWAAAGCEVTYVVITDGSIGSREPGMTREKLAEIRRAEQQAAADIAGAARCIFLGYPDGQLEPSLALRRDLTRLIRQYRPNVVICGDPTSFFPNNSRINHPDHRAAATAAIDAVFPSSDSPLLFPELLAERHEPHKVNYVYISNSADGTLFVDISDSIDTKIAALRQHKSQLGDWEPEERLKAWAQQVGSKVGFAYAEGFKKITLKEIEAQDAA